MAFDTSKHKFAPTGTVTTLTVSVGTGSNTIADVGAAFSQTTLNNNFRSLADKINVILAALQAAGTTL